ALAEGGEAAVERLAPALRERRAGAQRVEPQRLDLDRLADARRHDVIADPRVHPRELEARLAGGEQAIVIEADAVAGAARVAVENALDRRLQALPLARGRDAAALEARGEIVVHRDHVPERGVDRGELGL